VLAERIHDEPRQFQRPPGLLALHVAVRAHRAPHGYGSCVQVDLAPSQCPGFLGTDAGQQAEHDERVQPRRGGRFEQRGRLLGCQRLRRPSWLPFRCVDQSGDVAPHEVVSLGVPDDPGQAVVGLLQGAGRVARRHLRERRAHLARRQLGKPDRSEVGEQGLEGVVVGLDRLRRASGQAAREPVGDGAVDRVAMQRANPGVQLGVEVLQLVLDLGLGLAADLLAAALAVSAEAERDLATPPARAAALVMPAIAALPGVVEVDRVLAEPAAPGLRHDRKPNTWLPDWLPVRSLRAVLVPLTCRNWWS
jgi:hypothetical protein